MHYDHKQGAVLEIEYNHNKKLLYSLDMVEVSGKDKAPIDFDPDSKLNVGQSSY